MRLGGHDGWVEVITGVMFSGKSEELLRRVRRAIIAKKRVQVFKSHLDDRYGGVLEVSSHDGKGIDAHPVNSSVQIAELVSDDSQVVAIDEAQFLDEGVVDVVNRLADEGIRVIVAGTDMDFRGEPFGPDRLKGRWSFLFFGFTHCPDVCPTTLSVLAKVSRELEPDNGRGDGAQFVFVSVDPARDTPARLGEYVAYFDPDFLGVSGPDSALQPLAPATSATASMSRIPQRASCSRNCASNATLPSDMCTPPRRNGP